MLSEKNTGLTLAAGSYVFRSTFDDAANTDDVFVNLTPANTPEPGSIAVIGLGGLALLARRRRS